MCFAFSKKLTDCAGHFGYIQLQLPVFHAGYFRHTLTILQCCCKQCSRILLGPEDRASFLKKIKTPRIDALTKAAIFKRIVELCKRASTCPYCGYANGKMIHNNIMRIFYFIYILLGVVKKMTGGFFKIVHEKYRAKNADEQLDMQIRQMSEIVKLYPELKSNIQRPVVSIIHISSYFDANDGWMV